MKRDPRVPFHLSGMATGSRAGACGREAANRTDVQFRNLPARGPELAILGSMEFSFTDCYEAVRTRNPAFDGCFFTGVTSTGIFCRPVCPAVTPKPENCRFFPSAAAALEAGFRPCLRCRPESAPNSPAWNGVRTTVSRALGLIDQGALDEGNVESLAERLGVGSRHLRRLFSRHVGASPMQVARTRRLLTAKRLITDTDRPMSDIALASGFSSLRQFNHTFSSVYGKNPSAFRRAGGEIR